MIILWCLNVKLLRVGCKKMLKICAIFTNMHCVRMSFLLFVVGGLGPTKASALCGDYSGE